MSDDDKMKVILDLDPQSRARLDADPALKAMLDAMSAKFETLTPDEFVLQLESGEMQIPGFEKVTTRRVGVLESAFTDFQKRAIPENAIPDQINDMKVAFFLGALTLFSAITSMKDDDSEDVTDENENLLSGLQEELDSFFLSYQPPIKPQAGSA